MIKIEHQVKRVILVLFLMVIGFTGARSQDLQLPTEPANDFTFPLGTKFVIKLVPTDSAGYDFSVVSMEPFNEIIDPWSHDDLFSEEGEENTIVFYFCQGTHGTTDKERKENFRFVLAEKSYAKVNLKQITERQQEQDGEYILMDDSIMIAERQGFAMWSFPTYAIRLRGFSKVID